MPPEDAPPILLCDRCGDRIGVYERMWWQQPDGTLLTSAYLSIADGLHRLTGSRFLHLGCLEREGEPDPS